MVSRVHIGLVACKISVVKASVVLINLDKSIKVSSENDWTAIVLKLPVKKNLPLAMIFWIKILLNPCGFKSLVKGY